MKWKIPVSYVMKGHVVIDDDSIDNAEKALAYANEHLSEFELPTSSDYSENSLVINSEEEIEYIPDGIKLSDSEIDEIVTNFSNAIDDNLINGKISGVFYHLNNSYDIYATTDSELSGIFYISIKYTEDNSEICREIIHHEYGEESFLYLRIKIRSILKTYCK